MAITTKMTEVQNAITFGYSDKCNTLFTNGDWKASELARFSWCRWKDRYMGCVSATDTDVATSQGAAVERLLSYFQSDGGREKVKYVDDRISGEPYAFNILMYGRNNDLCLTSDNAANYRVVTSCSDFQKLYVKVNGYYAGNDRNIRFPVSRTIKENNLVWASGGVYNTDNNSYTEWITVWTVIVIDDDTFFVTRGMAFPNRTPCLYDGIIGYAQNNIRPSNALTIYNDPSSDSWFYPYGDITTYNKSKHLIRWYKNGLQITDTITFPGDYEDACWDVDDEVSVFLTGRATTSTRGNYSYTYYLRTEEAVKKAIAYTGLRWRYNTGDTEHIYTPIIDGDGYITGYSTDPAAVTKLNDIIDVTGNNISPVPPAPPGPSGDDEDNTDPVSTTGAPFGTGLAHYYVTTVDSAVLGQISEALGSWDIDTTKKDLYRNLISCKIIKPPAGIPSTPSVFEIYGVKPQYNGADITIPAVNGNPDITFGPYTISRKFGDFRDYAPYTRAEIFLPYCGWCALPSHVVGRSVSVSYFTDVIAGTVKAVVFCGDNPVAEAAGVMAYDIPFAAQNVGAKIQAANTGMLAYGKAALQLSAGIGQAVATKGKQGLSSIVSGAFGVAAGYNQLSMAANENYTEISGKAGDGCALAGIDTIIIKIVRPKYGAYTTPPFVPDGFAHTVGFLSMKEAKVSAASGLILCDNVDTSGIGKATDAERAEIKRVLETGLYVNNPPE